MCFESRGRPFRPHQARQRDPLTGRARRQRKKRYRTRVVRPLFLTPGPTPCRHCPPDAGLRRACRRRDGARRLPRTRGRPGAARREALRARFDGRSCASEAERDGGGADHRGHPERESDRQRRAAARRHVGRNVDGTDVRAPRRRLAAIRRVGLQVLERRGRRGRQVGDLQGQRARRRAAEDQRAGQCRSARHRPAQPRRRGGARLHGGGRQLLRDVRRRRGRRRAS